MKFLCLGAGAIGTYIGVSLIKAGFEVAFVERSEAIEQAAKNGLAVEFADGKRFQAKNPSLTTDALRYLDKNSVDYLIWAVKSFDNPALISSLIPAADKLPPIISLQNGVENEAQLSEAFGSAGVIPVSVCTAISRDPDGTVKVEKLRGIGISAESPFAEELSRAFSRANLKPALIHNASAMKWSKLITNLLANASSAILDMHPADIFADADGFLLEKRQILETLAVMNRLSIPVVNLPGTPVKLLAWAISHLPRFLLQPVLVKAVGGGRGGKMPSFHIDLEAGRTRSEVTFLNGAVSRTAEKLGISAPVNREYCEILTNLANGSLRRDTYRRKPHLLAGAIFPEEQ